MIAVHNSKVIYLISKVIESVVASENTIQNCRFLFEISFKEINRTPFKENGDYKYRFTTNRELFHPIVRAAHLSEKSELFLVLLVASERKLQDNDEHAVSFFLPSFSTTVIENNSAHSEVLLDPSSAFKKTADTMYVQLTSPFEGNAFYFFDPETNTCINRIPVQ